MATYEIKYQRPSSNGVVTIRVNASSASQAKEQIKARFDGNVKIISAVEK